MSGASALPARGYDRASAAISAFRRVLVVRFGRIGDLLMLTPALRALGVAVPEAAIDLLTTPVGAATLATNPRLRARHVLRRRRIPLRVNPEKIRLVRRLRALALDAVFLFERAPRYHALVEALGVTRVYALAPWGKPPGPYQIVHADDLHGVANFDRLLAHAGVPHAGWEYEMPIRDEAHRRADDLLREHGIARGAPVVGLHLGHFQRRRRWRRKCDPRSWPPDRYAEVVRRLASRGASRFIFTGSADEAALVARVTRELPRDRIVNLAGKTDLPTLGAVLRRCALFIAPDTGPAHLAAAVGTPLVALFSRLSPALSGPMGAAERVQHIYREPVDLPARARGDCHPRMYAITVEDVMDAVDRLHVRFD